MHLYRSARKWNPINVICLLAMVAVLAGCGGGGGGGSSAPLIAPELAVRQIQSGDTLNYSVTTTATNTENQTSKTTGTLKYTITNDTVQPLYGAHCFKMDVERILKLPDGQVTFNEAIYLEQDDDGTLYYCGWTGTFDQVDRRIVSCSEKPIYVSSPLRVGETYSYTADYTNDGKRQIEGSVVGYERVSGIYAYKIHEESPLNDPNWSSDKWVSAETGYDVKMIQTRIMDDGTVVKTVCELVSKNF